jgi:hypothetical protein
MLLAKLAEASKKKEISAEQTVAILYRWMLEGILPKEYHASVYQLDDGLDGIHTWYSQKKFARDLEEFFRPFAV